MGAIDMAAEGIAGAKHDIEDLLAPHGYYFLGDDDRAQLHLEFVSLSMVALGVLAWGAVQYLKCFLGETGKLHAQALMPKNGADADALSKRIDEMLDDLKLLSVEQRLSERRAALDAATLEAKLDMILDDTRRRRALLRPGAVGVIDPYRLAGFVEELGASSERAKEIGAEVGPTLEIWLDRLTKPRSVT
jgi:hypothetical protein